MNHHFDFLYCSLGYGALMQKMHHSINRESISGKTTPLSILIHGPKGVGKRALAHILAAELLSGHPWLSYGLPEFHDCWNFQLNAVGADVETKSERVKAGSIKEKSAIKTTFIEKFQPNSQPNSQLNQLRKVTLEWEKEHKKVHSHPEYMVLSLGAGIEDIRQFRQKLSYTRSSDSFRVVVLPEAQSLGLSSMNALLKWIENPGSRTVFVLTSSGALPETIRSRCIAYNMPALDGAAFTRVRSCVQTLQASENHDILFDQEGNQASESDQHLFKISQGALMRAQYWQEHLPWVTEAWSVVHRCATESPVIDPEWLSAALCLGDSVWDFWYIWSRDMYAWAYGQGFLEHWQYFWYDTWDLILQHQIYHTDASSVIQTVAARIHGFFMHYGVQPMPCHVKAPFPKGVI